ncbi:FxsA family protein [Corynebacterium breve]|uniref:FxsA family protein n=1 Tax=Corynebacterium breve TaxID=3049799 RepID=A0ABY8VJK5_9CORY|nr:FxsA family protein [Corynebacterium breve]WIM68828.1 FxsA family protein [Corynebacterium breve]
MRLIVGFLLIEIIAFTALGAAIGYGWAILVVLGLMLLGSLVASVSLRSTLARMQGSSTKPGQLAGDAGLILAGWGLSIVPGIVSSIVGLLIMFGPTRGIMRRAAARWFSREVENFGVRMYQHSPMANEHTSYGSFSDFAGHTQHSAGASHPTHEVIDADEIKAWTQNVTPDDFTKGTK